MATEERQPDETGAAPVKTDARKERKVLSALPRELSKEEFKSPGSQKWMLAELERLDEESRELKGIRDMYSNLRVEHAIAQANLRVSLSFEILSGALLAVGSAMLGYVQTLPASQGHAALMSGTFGAILIVASVVAKVVRRWK